MSALLEKKGVAQAGRELEPYDRERNKGHSLGHGAEPGEDVVSLSLLVRVAGASLIVLALFHAVLWRSLNWDREVERLSPLNARVFAVQTFFIASI